MEKLDAFGYGRIRHYSSGSDDSEKDYGYAHSAEFLASAEQTKGENCIRCAKKVYPTEKVEVGVQLHKNCFHCKDCNITLTLNSYILAKYDDSGRKEVYCKAHAPRASANTLDPEAIVIKNAVSAQQISNRPSFNSQIRLSDVSGWQYDPKAMEFEHAKNLHQLNRPLRPLTHDQEADDIEYEHGATIRKLRSGEFQRGNIKELAKGLAHVLDPCFSSQERKEKGNPKLERKSNDIEEEKGHKFPTNTDYMKPNALWSPAAVEDPWHPQYLKSRESELEGQQGFQSMYKNASDQDQVISRAPASKFDEVVHPPIDYNNTPDAHLHGGSNNKDNHRNCYDTGNEPIYGNADGTGNGNRSHYVNVPSSSDHLAPVRRSGRGSEKIYESLTSLGFQYPQTTTVPQLPPPRRPSKGPIRSLCGMDRFDRMTPMDRIRESYAPEPQYFSEERTLRHSDYNHHHAHLRPLVLESPMSSLPRQSRSVYPGPRDFLQEQAFIEQNQLELRQRREHGVMFREFESAREVQIRKLEDEIRVQVERAVQELFLHMDTGMFQGDINVEKLKIEQHFQRLKEENMRKLMSNLTGDERMRIDNLIDVQTQEMLQLIDKKVPAKLPSPRPHRKRKNALQWNAHEFDDVDFLAVQVAQYEQGSFTELVYELTSSCKSQTEKARSIFKWVTVKDLNKTMFSEELTEESPYYFLKGIKYGLESYHELFKRLCSYAGLPVKIIRGLSKSAGYRPGMPLGDSRFRNSWAVVYIDGAWRFVDSHWGARHVSDPDEYEHPRNFCYEVDEFYFLTDPEDMIYMHYPDDLEWQLLDTPVTLEGFIDMPVIKSHFVQYGLRFPQQMHSVIETDTGKVEIILRRNRKEPVTPLAYSTRLESDGEEFNGYCIHHFQGKDIIFNLCLPRRGVFYFSMFACDVDKSDSYNLITCFRIKCLSVEDKPFCKFPKLPDGYGPTKMAADMGMKTEKYDEYYLVCNEDKMIMNIKFACPVKVSHKLSGGGDGGSGSGSTTDAASAAATESTTGESNNLDRLVFQRYKDHGFVSFLIRFPERGIYVFSIFAGFRESATQTLECACRYLIQCNASAKKRGPARAFPKNLQYWHKCRLHEPTSGDLKLNKNVKFKLEVPDADAVAVIVGTQWYYLKREEEGGKVWEGVAHTGKETKLTVDVYFRCQQSDRDFFPLLEYRLIDED